MVEDKKRSDTPHEKGELKKKLGEKCVYCDCTNTLFLTIDHKNPLVRGGEDIDSNKQVCCEVCNKLKGALNHSEFVKYMKALKILKELCKIKMEAISPKLSFRPDHYPLKEFLTKEEFQKKKELAEEVKK